MVAVRQGVQGGRSPAGEEKIHIHMGRKQRLSRNLSLGMGNLCSFVEHNIAILIFVSISVSVGRG